MSKFIISPIKCAACGKESHQNVILSTSTLGKPDLDLRPQGMARSLLTKELQVCPHCSYSYYDISENYNRLDKIKAILDPSEIPQDMASAYVHAARLQEYIKNYKQAALLYLRAAWILDDNNENALSAIIRKSAAHCLEIDVNNTLDCQDAILLVDILRRAEDFERALFYINDIGTTQDLLFDSILSLERKLVLKKDSACHSIDEVGNE
ncbi:MAG: hypothetical protein IJ309_02025 [Clostridia bacterium]|nr:hypothetical protein [Clostridia bacterium]